MSVKIEKGAALDALNMTPLIDVVFLLLIFFLVATKFAEEELESPVQLAEAAEAMPMTATPKEMVVNIDEQGRYFVSGQVLAIDEVEAAIERRRVNNPTKATVNIRIDRRCPWQSVVDVIDACRRTGVTYHSTTRPPDPTANGS